MLKIMTAIAMMIMAIRYVASTHKGTVAQFVGDAFILITLYATAFCL